MRKSISIVLITLVVLVSFSLLVNVVYADATDTVTYDLTTELTEAQVAELSNFDTLAKMMTDIFSFDRHMGDNSLNDTGSLLYELIDSALVKFDDFTNSTMYRYIQGLALLFLMINFMIKLYEDNQFDFEDEMITKEIMRSCVYFVFALLIIILLKYYVKFLLSFFRFLVDKMITLKTNNDLGTVETLTNTIKPKTVAYYILQDSQLVGSGSLIQEVAIRSKEASLRSMYMFPWILTWISKVGELIIVFLNSTLLIVYGTYYSLSIFNILNDIKTSNFLKYSRFITAIAVEEVVIIGVIYISEIMLNPYMNRILNNIASGKSDLSFVSMAIIVTAVSFTKFVLLVLTFPLSKRLLGAK
ncbi:MAG: hypothetical protein IJP71_02250 [Lachnospiraceae bacterium]|nr:hypothetical protein [Lachnospiraceae bacterium]